MWRSFASRWPRAVSLSFLLIALLSPLLTARVVRASPIVVNSIFDSGPGTLRQAILDANAASGADTITFSIAGGTQRIVLFSPLPAISDDVTIDGSTQPGYAGTPLIVIDGNLYHAFSITSNTVNATMYLTKQPASCTMLP
jgi:hypothetical protein